MNPSLKFILIIIISFEISLTANLYANLSFILICLGYLIFNKVSMKTLFNLLLIPLLAAIAIFISIYYFSPDKNLNLALLLFSRIYSFVFLGATITLTTSIESLVKSLEQNFKLPSKFAYGILAAYNIIPKIKNEVIRIKTAAMMRGMHFSFLSPRLYFKAILSALTWSQDLTQGMISHGYQEEKSRSAIIPITITKRDYFIFFSLLCISQIILFYA